MVWKEVFLWPMRGGVEAKALVRWDERRCSLHVALHSYMPTSLAEKTNVHICAKIAVRLDGFSTQLGMAKLHAELPEREGDE